ncbi:hypothetical protein BST95_14420 [Halioglobus japonicus]|uniref:Alpha/beta hydrolase n=1 Tax=Halioglobus japonicus TaxID=930805 RepID=A0AAP8MH27_9GAMM|nr:alpha/beta hydrolase [Halioglobus japonicus]AQA19259.1 hypothetical protein BST95_14420 [Halioglobus japonicus]PLW87703.1 alpha/beta hydrolase [Halioglobus japonicus]GHD07027.1 hypothetical protein GCM10007052_02400 [Halioglobus japonicus]
MSVFTTLMALAVGIFLGCRYHFANKVQPRRFTADWPGRDEGGALYCTGDTVIAVRTGSEDDSRTVVAFPGFLEDMRYFQALYQDFTGQLILVNNADYHNPFDGDITPLVDWSANPYPLGTIEHDGFVLAQVVQQLASGTQVTVHGHSRGGAVTLEAARQFPAVMRPEERAVSAILEAAVLPQARTVGPTSRPLGFTIARWIFPLVMTLLRKAPPERILENPMMRPTNPLKTALCQSIFFTPRRYATAVTNFVSIRRWQAEHTAVLFNGYAHIDVVIGEKDHVLDNPTMTASAEQGAEQNAGLNIVHTQQTNHFVSLEQPAIIRALVDSAKP